MAYREIEVVVKLKTRDSSEAAAYARALAADDWSDTCATSSGAGEECFLVIRVLSKCPALASRARALVDDVFRIVGALDRLSEKLK